MVGGKILYRSAEGNTPAELNFIVSGAIAIDSNKYETCITQGSGGFLWKTEIPDI